MPNIDVGLVLLATPSTNHVERQDGDLETLQLVILDLTLTSYNLVTGVADPADVTVVEGIVDIDLIIKYKL